MAARKRSARSKRYTAEQKVGIVKQLEKHSVSAVNAATGVSVGTLRLWADAAGVTPPDGRRSQPPPAKLPNERPLRSTNGNGAVNGNGHTQLIRASADLELRGLKDFLRDELRRNLPDVVRQEVRRELAAMKRAGR